MLSKEAASAAALWMARPRGATNAPPWVGFRGQGRRAQAPAPQMTSTQHGRCCRLGRRCTSAGSRFGRSRCGTNQSAQRVRKLVWRARHRRCPRGRRTRFFDSDRQGQWSTETWASSPPLAHHRNCRTTGRTAGLPWSCGTRLRWRRPYTSLDARHTGCPCSLVHLHTFPDNEQGWHHSSLPSVR